MEFYKECFECEVFLMTVAEAPGNFPVEAKDLILHSTLHAGTEILMAADSWTGAPYQPGNNFYGSHSVGRPGGKPAAFRRAWSRWEGHHAVTGHVLGRSFRDAYGSIRRPVDVQLRAPEMTACRALTSLHLKSC
jgi:hypothetical protein